MTGLILVMPGGGEQRIPDADELIKELRDSDTYDLTGRGAWIRAISK